MRILMHPHPKLAKEACGVFEFDETLNKFLGAMEQAMRKANGIGIAANQVGIPIAAFIMVGEDGVSKEFINPQIESMDTEVKSNEGCLSLPQCNATITRFENLVLKYQNAKGELFTESFSGRNAIIIQHEMDHLKGKVFISHLSKLQYDRITKKYKRIFYTTGRGSLFQYEVKRIQTEEFKKRIGAV